MPTWTEKHMFQGNNFTNLTTKQLIDLQNQIKKCSSKNPEVSIVVPVWNEQDSVFRALSSLSANETNLKVELIVINNNSTDATQSVLDKLGVINFLQITQGTPFARQMGLENAKGKYFLCADADTLYPPKWIDCMVAPMMQSDKVTGVYGRYSFIPPNNNNRMGLWFYELFTAAIIRIRKNKREYLNTYGFNMGFVRKVGIETGGFNVSSNRKYNNAVGNDNTNDAEDGRMARNLSTKGDLVLVTDPRARVFTSARRLMDDGSLWKAFTKRIKYQLKIFKEFT